VTEDGSAALSVPIIAQDRAVIMIHVLLRGIKAQSRPEDCQLLLWA